ncbi:MAG: hypothetical protein NVS1B11_03300 [Terriglobales bacterium]
MRKKINSLLLAVLTACGLGAFTANNLAHAESTISCPSGTYDMLDWMRWIRICGSSLTRRVTQTRCTQTFYQANSIGQRAEMGLLGTDNNFIYLWITEYSWNDPDSYKAFGTFGTSNMRFTARCAKGGSPGSSIRVSNTSYKTYTTCTSSTNHNLKTAVNEVWGPYTVTYGGGLPKNLPSLVVSYRYNCDQYYGNCSDKEAFYLTQRYGLAQWIHYKLMSGKYSQVQKTVFNQLSTGVVTPNFVCF